MVLVLDVREALLHVNRGGGNVNTYGLGRQLCLKVRLSGQARGRVFELREAAIHDARGASKFENKNN